MTQDEIEEIVARLVAGYGMGPEEAAELHEMGRLAALSRPAPPDDIVAKLASIEWAGSGDGDGIASCPACQRRRFYHDDRRNHRADCWLAAALAAPAPVAAPAPETPDVIDGQCPRCGERDSAHAADCRHWTCDHCGHDRAAHRDGVASRLERDGHFHPCRAAQAHGYLSRVFVHHAPQCMPLPDLMGVCTQIDNLLTGMLAPGIAVERCGYVHAHGWTCGRAKGHPGVHVPPSRIANPPAPETPAPDAMPAIQVGDIVIEASRPYAVRNQRDADLCQRYANVVDAIYRDPLWRRQEAQP